MVARKGDTFEKETQLLERGKLVSSDSSLGLDGFRMAFLEIVGGYEELLDEAKFLTKVSDRLEKKLSKANEELAKNNVKIKKENDGLAKENQNVKAKNNHIIAEHQKIGKKLTKFQMAVMIIVFLIGIMVFFALYILFGDDKTGGILGK